MSNPDFGSLSLLYVQKDGENFAMTPEDYVKGCQENLDVLLSFTRELINEAPTPIHAALILENGLMDVGTEESSKFPVMLASALIRLVYSE